MALKPRKDRQNIELGLEAAGWFARVFKRHEGDTWTSQELGMFLAEAQASTLTKRLGA